MNHFHTTRSLVAAVALSGALLTGLAPAASAATTTVPACEAACFLDVRTGVHPDYDRLVIDLGGPSLPTWTANSDVTGLSREDGSGEPKPIALTGKHFLAIQMTGVNNFTSEGFSFTGPTVQSLNLPAIKGYALTGGYEGEYGFGLALGDYSRYQISTLTSPNRLVVDIYH